MTITSEQLQLSPVSDLRDLFLSMTPEQQVELNEQFPDLQGIMKARVLEKLQQREEAASRDLSLCFEHHLQVSGMTKTQLAEASGVNYQNLHNWLKGTTEPKFSNFVQVMKVMGYDVKLTVTKIEE